MLLRVRLIPTPMNTDASAAAGILTAMTSPVVTGIMLLALLPSELIGIALVGTLGAMIGSKAFARLMPAS
jgi:hypothetical protein